MKKIKTYFAAALFFFTLSCCSNKIPPRAIEVAPVAPRIEQVGRQAKITTDHADRTVILTQIVKSKYAEDKDAEAANDSARLTALESKETETQLRVLSESVKESDKKVVGLSSENNALRGNLEKSKAKISSLEAKIKELKSKLSTKNGYLLSAGLIILILLALVTKPWKLFY